MKRVAHNFQNLTGLRFGRHVVLGRAPDRGRHIYWLCRCTCGTEKEVAGDSLKAGLSLSCGCLMREAVAARRTIHGHTKGVRGGNGNLPSKEYLAWQNMRKRCNDPKSSRYEQYGGRGIRVCERWNEFANFLDDLGQCPKDHSLDRIDNNGNYEPGNVRWATKEQQVNNKQQSVKYPWQGQMLTIAQIAKAVGCSQVALYKRVRLRGQNLEKAVHVLITK